MQRRSYEIKGVLVFNLAQLLENVWSQRRPVTLRLGLAEFFQEADFAGEDFVEVGGPDGWALRFELALGHGDGSPAFAVAMA